MTDHASHDDAASRPDDATLCAYLDGDLDAVAHRRLERRLADDPDLAARLDDLADTLAALRRVDQVTPPPGYHQRLRRRLSAAPVAATPPRPHRRPGVVAAAAAAAAIAVVVAFPATLPDAAAPDVGDDPSPETADDAAPPVDEEAAPAPPATTEAAPDAAPDRDDGLDTADGAAAPADGDAARTLPPLRVDADAAAVDGPAALWGRYDGAPELDAPVGDATAATLAARDRDVADALARLDAAACAPTIPTLFAGDHAVVRLEGVHVRDRPRLVVVAAVGDGRGEAVLLDPDRCTPVAREPVARR